MIKKNFKKLLSISLATGILIGGATASAEVIGYVTEFDGVRYEYSQGDLIQSIIGGTDLYERYKSEKLVALVDDKNGYIDAEDVIDAIIKASIKGKTLVVDEYTESEVAKAIELKGVKRLDSNGQVLPGDQVGDGEENEPEDEKLEYTDVKYFEFDASKGEITEYSWDDDAPKDVVIPSEIDGIAVTNIGGGAFISRNIDSIVIPNSVTSIGNRAFKWNDLESVEIPNSVTNIEDAAFAYNNLESVEISDSVTSIGNRAFTGNNLSEKDVKLGSGHPSFWLYDEDDATKLTGHIMGGISGALVIPDGITSIGDGAFMWNSLTSVEIPSSVTSIGEGAFAHNNLESIEIPNSVTSIGEWVFAWNRLTSLKIPNSVTSIEEGAFHDNDLVSVEIPNSVTSIGEAAFSWNNLKSVRVPSHTALSVRSFVGSFGEDVEIIRY